MMKVIKAIPVIHLYKPMEQPITDGCLEVSDYFVSI